MATERRKLLSKPYLVFKGDYYYPSGGYRDFVGAYESYAIADNAAQTGSSEWAHIVRDGKIIMSRHEHNRDDPVSE